MALWIVCEVVVVRSIALFIDEFFHGFCSWGLKGHACMVSGMNQEIMNI